MSNNLLKIQLDYLKQLYEQIPDGFETWLPARKQGNAFLFKAFGQDCILKPDGITLGGKTTDGPEGVLISLYGRHANPEQVQLEPIKSFKQIKGTMPYQVGFSAHAEQSLEPYVAKIHAHQEKITEIFDGHDNEGARGDFSFTLYPLPKVPLYYNFFLADEEFPAAVKCLLASNAESFMPLDGLADVGEYTAKRIIEILKQ